MVYLYYSDRLVLSVTISSFFLASKPSHNSIQRLLLALCTNFKTEKSPYQKPAPTTPQSPTVSPMMAAVEH